MKQRIEPTQLEDLSPKAFKRLLKWWQPKQGDLVYQNEFGLISCVNGEGVFEDDGTTWPVDKKTEYPLLSIGRMFEFLDEHDCIPLDDEADGGAENLIWWEKEGELADCLWSNMCDALEAKS